MFGSSTALEKEYLRLTALPTVDAVRPPEVLQQVRRGRRRWLSAALVGLCSMCLAWRRYARLNSMHVVCTCLWRLMHNLLNRGSTVCARKARGVLRHNILGGI